MMERKLLTLSAIFLLCLPIFGFKVAYCLSKPKVDWAVLIVGTNAVLSLVIPGGFHNEEALHNAYYMYYVLRNDFGVPADHIKFLHINPEGAWREIPDDVWDSLIQCNKSMVKWVIRYWLAPNATLNDNVLIYIGSHGGGWYADENRTTNAARVEINSDEGNETRESTYGRDINNDGDQNDWFGVDEGLVFYDTLPEPDYVEYYYDDELRWDLMYVHCNQMMIILQPCFSGDL